MGETCNRDYIRSCPVAASPDVDELALLRTALAERDVQLRLISEERDEAQRREKAALRELDLYRLSGGDISRPLDFSELFRLGVDSLL